MRPDQDDRPKEECGVLGVYSPDQDAARIAFFSLFALQHRGQEAAGIAVSDGFRVRMHKDLGLVNQVFGPEELEALPGHMAVGHTRYSTTGASVLRNAQPVFCQSLVGEVAVAHNGNLINAKALRCEMEEEGEVFDSTSDSEILARLLVRHLGQGPEVAVAEVMKRVKGAYSVTVLTPKLLLGFRDPSGIRPLTTGVIEPAPGSELSTAYMIASETCAFGPVGAKPFRELEAGEAVVVDGNGMRFFRAHEKERGGMCLFEFIYFARPDSVMHKTLLYTARERMGENLAKEHPVEADVVVPVPDSGVPAALGYSKVSGIPFREGMTKSRYIHRTFIAPDQQLRSLGVRMKLTPLEDHIRGQRVVLVDDSIVRGTTTGQIVGLLFESGATEVHVRITAPPIRFPCFYGIDMASKEELAAAKWSIQELEKKIGATSLGFLSIPGAVNACGEDADRFCLACFNGDYPIRVPQDHSRDPFAPEPCVGEMAGFAGGQPRLFND